jgi:hypothetical protein
VLFSQDAYVDPTVINGPRALLNQAPLSATSWESTKIVTRLKQIEDGVFVR